MTKAANLAASANATAGNVTATNIQSNAVGTPTVFQDSAGTQVGTLCRAWVNFNGTTAPPTIRASFNVTSVTKNTTGDYTLNFTTAMPDANYCYQITTSSSADASTTNLYTSNAGTGGATVSTGSLRISYITGNDAGERRDTILNSVSVFR